jgi:hypothetical protein
MSEWEYIRLSMSDIPLKTRTIDALNSMGKDGWELVTITRNNTAYLRRPSKGRVQANATTRKSKAP